MEKSTNDFLIKAALIAGGAYLLYKYVLQPMLSAAKVVTQPVANVIADSFLWWKLPKPVNVSGKFILQTNGAVLDPDRYPVTWIDAATDPRAVNYGGQLPSIEYGGRTFVIGPHDDMGNNPAILL